MVLKPDKEDLARRIFEKWDLDFAVIGRLTETGRMVIRKDGTIEADLPIPPIAGSSPEYDRPWVETPRRRDIDPAGIDTPNDIASVVLGLAGGPHFASRRWIWEQYDHMVMGDTVGRPGGDAAVVRLHGSTRALAITTDCTPRYCEADPVAGGAQAVAETWRNLTAVGAKPLAITDNMNFGSPERPEIMGQFVGCIEGIRAACLALDYPVVSGNVSFYNETNGQAILPTPVIGGVGLIDDLSTRVDLALGRTGDALVLIGRTTGHLGASAYLRDALGREDGPPPPVDLAAERRNGDFVRAAIHSGLVSACHDVSDGGIAMAVVEMAVAGRRGAEIAPPGGSVHPVAWLFGEDQARYIVATDRAEEILTRARDAGVPAERIGTVGGDALTFGRLKSGDWGQISVSALVRAHEHWLPDYMARP